MKWLQICLVLVVLVAASKATNFGYRSPLPIKLPKIYEEKIEEMLRLWVANGIPEIGVPVLDPFEIAKVVVPRISYEDIVTIDKLNLENVRADGLGNFKNNKIALDLAGLSGFDLEVDLGWPSLKAKGSRYEFNASLVGVIELFGDGAFNGELTDARGRVKLGIRTGDDGYLYISAVELGPATFSELNIQLDGLMGGGRVSELLNEVIHLMAKDVWDKAEPTVCILLERIVKDLVNQELAERKITMEDVLEWISNLP